VLGHGRQEGFRGYLISPPWCALVAGPLHEHYRKSMQSASVRRSPQLAHLERVRSRINQSIVLALRPRGSPPRTDRDNDEARGRSVKFARLPVFLLNVLVFRSRALRQKQIEDDDDHEDDPTNRPRTTASFALGFCARDRSRMTGSRRPRGRSGKFARLLLNVRTFPTCNQNERSAPRCGVMMNASRPGTPVVPGD
jgi:hypothetical protein